MTWPVILLAALGVAAWVLHIARPAPPRRARRHSRWDRG